MHMTRISTSLLPALIIATLLVTPALAVPIDALGLNVNVAWQLLSDEPIELITERDKTITQTDHMLYDESIKEMLAQFHQTSLERSLMKRLANNTWWPDEIIELHYGTWLKVINKDAINTKAIATLDHFTNEDFAAIWGFRYENIESNEYRSNLQNPVWTRGLTSDEPRLFAKLTITRRS